MSAPWTCQTSHSHTYTHTHTHTHTPHTHNTHTHTHTHTHTRLSFTLEIQLLNPHHLNIHHCIMYLLKWWVHVCVWLDGYKRERVERRECVCWICLFPCCGQFLGKVTRYASLASAKTKTHSRYATFERSSLIRTKQSRKMAKGNKHWFWSLIPFHYPLTFASGELPRMLSRTRRKDSLKSGLFSACLFYQL